MHPEVSRVVYNNQPYLVVPREDGSVERAYGPFTPGTEPNLSECTPETEVHELALLATLQDLLPMSPPLPTPEDTLAGS
jgi:hypothetical protein